MPDSVLVGIGKQIVHRLAVGLGDITGDDFGTILAAALQAVHRPKPLGIGDVEWNGCAWSAKTVKASRPFNTRKIRLISGRNSPDFSLSIENPHEDIHATGEAVLSIWNARVDQALAEYQDLRIAILIRNVETREFVVFEEEAQRFVPTDYEWSYTKQGNLQAISRATGAHTFSWQFSGSQFTILKNVPSSARRFKIGPDVPLIEPDVVWANIGFEDDWIELL